MKMKKERTSYLGITILQVSSQKPRKKGFLKALSPSAFEPLAFCETKEKRCNMDKYRKQAGLKENIP